MIPANELRLGNKILKLAGYVVEVDIDTLIRIKRSPQFYKPIPLTPEVLEKCGFENDISVGVWLKKNRPVELTSIAIWDKGNDVPYKFCMHDNKPFPIHSLHQLQNLYFALTGEELTVNLQATSPV